MQFRPELLPNDWHVTTIGESCDVLDSMRVPLNQEQRAQHQGDVPYYGANGQLDSVDDYIFDEELVLIAEDGGHFDEYETRPIAYMIKGKSWVNNHAHVLRASSGTTNSWIFYNLVHRDIRQYVRGTTRHKLNQTQLREIPIPRPPLEEQRRIATILDTVDDAIRQTDELIAKLQQIKAGLLHDLLTRGLDEAGRLRDPDAHPEQFKTVRGIRGFGTLRIPRSWQLMTVKDICEIGRGRVISKEEIREHPGTYPVYSSQTTNEGIFGYLDTYDFDGEYVTWTTDGANAGTVFHRSGRFNCTNICGTLAPATGQINMHFLAIALSRHTGKHVSRVGNDKLMNNVMAEIRVEFPPLEEQQRITQALNANEARVHTEEAYRDKLTKLKQGLMQDLLTGRVRVTDIAADLVKG